MVILLKCAGSAWFFANCTITWKGWKEFDTPTIDETPWGDYGGYGNDVEDAKQICEDTYREFLVQELMRLGDILDREQIDRICHMEKM